MDNVDVAWLQFKENPKRYIDEQKKGAARFINMPTCGDLKISQIIL